MTTKRTPTSPKKTTAVRILRRIGVIVGIIAACLFLLYAVLMGYERISQYIVYKEAEQLLNDPMGRKDLLGMRLESTTINPRTNIGLLRRIYNHFYIESQTSEDKLKQSLELEIKNSGWTITESYIINESLYTIDAKKLKDNKPLTLTIYIDKVALDKFKVHVTIRYL